MRFHSSCLFTLISHCRRTLACALPLVLSFFHTGQSLSVDFGLCASTRLVFFHTGQSLSVDLACALPLVLSFFNHCIILRTFRRMSFRVDTYISPISPRLCINTARSKGQGQTVFPRNVSRHIEILCVSTYRISHTIISISF